MRRIKLKPGQALIIQSPLRAREGWRVSLQDGIVWPHQKAEVIDLTAKPLEVSMPSRSKDGQAVLVKATFLVSIKLDPERILEVAHIVGCDRAGDPKVLGQLFNAQFCEAITEVVSRLEYHALTAEQSQFRDALLTAIGDCLNGYFLEDIIIHEIAPRMWQEVVLGHDRFTLDWIEVRRSARIDQLVAEHGVTVLARRLTDGSVQHAPAGDTRVGPGEAIAVAVASDRYEAIQRALNA